MRLTFFADGAAIEKVLKALGLSSVVTKNRGLLAAISEDTFREVEVTIGAGRYRREDRERNTSGRVQDGGAV